MHRKTNSSTLDMWTLQNVDINRKKVPSSMKQLFPASSISVRYSRQFVFAALWMLIALPLSGQIAGFTGADNDRDGLPDDFEQAILEKFRPTWKISTTDCDVLPAEFVPGIVNPTVKARNGTIYGQVFNRGSSSLGYFIEAHFYDLWGTDCGYINSHLLDAEHVSVLIRVLDPSQPLSEWHASQWYAGAHEDTICDASQFGSAALIDAEDHGATFWIARGKHGAFFSPQACSIGGCGLDRCETATMTLSPSPVNIGELAVPLNGAVWTSSDQWPLAVKMRTDFPTFSTFSSLFYSFPDHGGDSYSTTGSPVATTVGYGSIQSIPGTALPAGMSIFGFRKNNVLVTEAGVPISPLISSGRIYAEEGGSVHTGLAIVNPNSEPAQITFYFTDANGQNFGRNTTSISARQLLGRFLYESPYNVGAVRGTFTFTSSVPVSVVAIRGYTNERGEFLITTLPISSLSATVGQNLVFPHIADGGGWTTELALVNPTDDVITGTVQFFGQGTAGAPADALELNLNGQTGSIFTYTIAPRSSWVGKTAGTGPATRVGSARVTPSASNSAASAAAVFSFRRNGFVVTESGVAATTAGSGFRLFVESSGNFNAAEVGSLQTGIAITNLADTPALATLELTNLDGASVGTTGTILLPAKGQLAMFLNQLPGFSAIASPFQGILRIATSSGSIAVIGLRGRYNERRDFLIATTPAANESVAGPTADAYFPYIAEGGGYTTQFILSSPPGNLASSGWLRFYAQAGAPLNLSLK